MGRVFSVGVVLASCLLAATPGHAQTPAAAAAPPAPPPPAQTTQPVTGFVSSYEITKIAESAGFDPLAPPLREGTSYVLRATDYRGILMRVVIDARTGAIRDATRIVPGPGRYGAYYGAASPYDPTAFDEPDMGPPLEPPSPLRLPPPPPVFAPTHPGASAIVTPPLPRPRPAALSSEISAAAPAPSSAAPRAPSAAPAQPSAAPKKPATVEPLND